MGSIYHARTNIAEHACCRHDSARRNNCQGAMFLECRPPTPLVAGALVLRMALYVHHLGLGTLCYLYFYSCIQQERSSIEYGPTNRQERTADAAAAAVLQAHSSSCVLECRIPIRYQSTAIVGVGKLCATVDPPASSSLRLECIYPDRFK